MAFTVKFEGYISGAWVDLSADLLAGAAIKLSSGIGGGGIGDRVASGGEFSAEMNNSATNSGGLVGYYSPGHAAARAGWDFAIKVRASVTRGGTTYYKFVGWIDEITPAPGVRGPRAVTVRAVDLMGIAAEWKIAGIPTQIAKRSDQVFSTVVASLPVAAEATTIGTGRSTFAYALDTSRDESLTVLGEFQRIASSEVGHIFVKGDTSAGGRLVFQSRGDRAAVLSNAYVFDNTMAGLVVRRARSAVYDKIQVTTHGRRIDASAVVLAELQSTPLIAPGAVYTWLSAYRDPDQEAARVGGTGMIPPVATTDYTFNGAADGSGSDLTASLSIVASFGGNGVRFSVTNAGTVAGYITKLPARGLGLYDYENLISEIDNGALGARRVGALDLSYESDANVGIHAAQYLAAIFSDEGQAIAESLTVVGDGAALEAAICSIEIGDRIGLVETVTGAGLGALPIPRGYFVQGIDLVIGPAPSAIRATYTLTPAGRSAFWRIGYARLGVGEALLGF